MLVATDIVALISASHFSKKKSKKIIKVLRFLLPDSGDIFLHTENDYVKIIQP